RFRQPDAKLPPLERLYRILADDSIEPYQWVRAADVLVERPWDPPRAGTASFAAGIWMEPPDRSKLKLRGEPLRKRVGPSVSELLVHRMSQLNDIDYECRMALDLVEWDAAAAKPHLPLLMRRCLDADRVHRAVELLEARANLGDMQALDEYAGWIRSK